MITNDNFQNLLFEIEDAYHTIFSLMLRGRLLSSPCKQRIFSLKLLYWSNFLVNNIKLILDGKCDKIELYDVTEEVVDTLINKKLISPAFGKFYVQFHAHFAKDYLNNLQSILNKETNFRKKVLLFISEFAKFANITLTELEGLQISCKIFDEDNENCCNFCKDSPNIIILTLTPAYLQFEESFNKLVSSFKMIKSKDVILVVDYSVICSELKEYSWENHDADSRYNEVRPYFKEIYFVNCSCVDFGAFKDKYNLKIITSKITKIVDIIRHVSTINSCEPCKNLISLVRNPIALSGK